MVRADRGRSRPEPVPDEPDEDDITAARRIAHQGTQDTRGRITRRQRGVAYGVIAAIVLVLLANASVTVYLGQQLSQATLEQADQKRTNGAAQEQARRALEAAGPANEELRRKRLFPVELQGPDRSPSFAVIANSATAQVLADMPRDRIVAGDFVALGQATDRFYARNPVITQSGPDPLQVQQLGVLYLLVAQRLAEQGAIPR